MPAALNLRALTQLMRISAVKNMTAAIITPTANHIAPLYRSFECLRWDWPQGSHKSPSSPLCHDTVRNICGHDLANMICPIDSATRLSVL